MVSERSSDIEEFSRFWRINTYMSRSAGAIRAKLYELIRINNKVEDDGPPAAEKKKFECWILVEKSMREDVDATTEEQALEKFKTRCEEIGFSRSDIEDATIHVDEVK
jgi:hypothetical protein